MPYPNRMDHIQAAASDQNLPEEGAKTGRDSAAKVAITVRLRGNSLKELKQIADTESRTVSNLIDGAVKEFLGRRNDSSDVVLNVQHAALPDTSVLKGFFHLAQEAYKTGVEEKRFPNIYFPPQQFEWSRLMSEVMQGEMEVVESVNWQSILKELANKYTPPRFDWMPPYLQLFGGHCVFSSASLVKEKLGKDDLESFMAFRSIATTGRELSRHSLAAWANMSDLSSEEKTGRAAKLAALWSESIVCCQLGTDFHIALLRLTSLLEAMLPPSQAQAALADAPRNEPIIQGVDDLDNAFAQFNDGVFTAFIGNMLHTTELLAEAEPHALLLAGPADLRITSLNTLVGAKGQIQGSGGEKIATLWRDASKWFNEMVGNPSIDTFGKFVAMVAPTSSRGAPWSEREIILLKSLMQTWVKVFPDALSAQALVGHAGDNKAALFFLAHYESMCKKLADSEPMPAPQHEQAMERSFWKFPFPPLRPQSA